MTRADPDTGRALALGQLDHFVGPRVRVLWNLLSASMAKALAPFGLRPGAFSALALIEANPGCSQNQLAQALGMDKSAVTTVVRDLERRGLAVRVRGRDDRRFRALKLTAKGNALLQRMVKPASGPGQPIRDALSAREMKQLISLLDRAGRALVMPQASKPRAARARRRSAERTAQV